MDEPLYKSNKQKKVEERQALQLDTIIAKRRQEATERWTNVQIKAAGFQSAWPLVPNATRLMRIRSVRCA